MCALPQCPATLQVVRMGLWPSVIFSLPVFDSSFSLACGCCGMWSLEDFLPWGSGPLDSDHSLTPCGSMKMIKM